MYIQRVYYHTLKIDPVSLDIRFRGSSRGSTSGTKSTERCWDWSASTQPSDDGLSAAPKETKSILEKAINKSEQWNSIVIHVDMVRGTHPCHARFACPA